ncbi:MAG: ABC transporter substrate-binding protein [Lachnospiraceae bacterium]|nr:ABC transporter substrate-binding protein [Lachnospiraceae bacterium]
MKKKMLALLLAVSMVMALSACGSGGDEAKETQKKETQKETEAAPAETKAEGTQAATEGGEASSMDELIAAAQEEGELVVYGSCEDAYISAACQAFEAKYGIKTSWQRLTGGEVQAKLEEENGNPSADVWFGGTSDPQSVCASEGLLMAYDAQNKSHLISADCSDPDGYWYGIYRGILGIFYNKEELDRLEIEYPTDWDDLLDPKYEGLIWFSNPNTASTAKLAINTFVQQRGHDGAMDYFVALDKNVAQYTKSGGGPSKSVGSGECVIGIGFLHDAVYQITQGYDNIGMCIPASGTTCETGATSIFAGCKHPNAAKLWIEFCLTPECVELADDTGSFQFLVLDNAEQPAVLADFDLDPNNTLEYDFADAKENTQKYVEDLFEALGSAADSRFKTE